MEPRPPVPPFTLETARQKVKAAEDAWNTRDPERVSLAYTPDSQWRNRDVHVVGRAALGAQHRGAKLLACQRVAVVRVEGDGDGRAAGRFGGVPGRLELRGQDE